MSADETATCSRCGQPRPIYAKRRRLCKTCYPLDLKERRASATSDQKPMTDEQKVRARDTAEAVRRPRKRVKVACEVAQAPTHVKTRQSVETTCACGFEVFVPVGKLSVTNALERAQQELDFHLT